MLPHGHWRKGANISKYRSTSTFGLLDPTVECTTAFRNIRDYLPGDTAFLLQDSCVYLQRQCCETHESGDVGNDARDAYLELRIVSLNKTKQSKQNRELLISWGTILFLLSWVLIRVCCRYKQPPGRTIWRFKRFHSEPQKIK